jgi:glyoxylase-like metal-dependent hydrolase (beta-lactamase superfamily II)
MPTATSTVMRCMLLAACLATAATAAAQDFGLASIRAEPVGDGLWVFFGDGPDVIAGNMLVSIGEDGVLVVDDQVPGMTPKYEATIASLGGGDIAFVINTHWHFDHADGNALLGEQGVFFVSHENSRTMMMRDKVVNLVDSTVDQPAYARAAWPVFTYDTTMRVHFNGDTIDLMHFGPAHTTGDTAVIFRDRNLVHLGDVFNTSGYPYIDADNGGTLDGVIAFCRAVLRELLPGAVVIAGHGPVSNYEGLEDYVAMLSTIRDRMSSLVASGATLEQVVAADLTSDWDHAMGDPTRLIDRAYAGMTR